MSDKRKDMDPDPDPDLAEHVPTRGVQLELELHRRKLWGQ